ncbi:MAG: type II toxin-antitoxin system VapC family toxin [Candidatus Parabeggiatoa sp. nov. 2]|nr:MAG: VapC toxin family PIN domain ribonuclease [Beggiatoa sp. 4572_84]RKZ56993.1 MAG: type II toxin-antitoxin system VapC family toxin [Gammaproteobacteria bacterium]HEC86078.1 type II toxin-antitoxin system VapC family toxin [Thioploca sp.]
MNPSEPLLIDTDVVIDYLRGNPQAIAFIQQAPLVLWISSMTVAELYAGVREGEERELLEQTLATYILCDIDSEIAELGGLYRRDYGKSHGVGLVDALIAATAKLRGYRLVTLNKKHFPMLDNVLIPYKKH